MTQVHVKLSGGEGVSLYGTDRGIVLQVRRLVHGADDPLAASFKTGVLLTAAEASRVAAELLTLASRDLKVQK
jgi:hypothetical protein